MAEPVRRAGSRRAAAVLITVLALVIAAFVVVGIVTAAASPAGPVAPSSTAPAATVTPSPGSSASASVTPTPTASATAKPKPTKVAVPKVQPTATATISAPKAIVKRLTAKVSKMEAVTGKANAPGEVGGPSVRFTITITNTTGKSVNLSNTVVNAYYGSAATPAIELQSPGGADFPASVATGRSATGVFVFNIPTASRGSVKVTVDTSVNNPVVAFKGAAPK